MVEFKDHFSAGAAGYATYRPQYPEALFAWLASQCNTRAVAWDCATGSGQAARGLAKHFRRVIATDASFEQIANAAVATGVEYRAVPAEASGLPGRSCDLVTVAQAAHWFDIDAFYAEVRRVLKPGGLVALWGYEKLSLEPDLARIVGRFYHGELEGFWPPERALVESGYRDLPFPFREMSVPEFAMRTDWTLDQLVGYVATWSAVKNCRLARGEDPIPALRERLLAAWGSPESRKTIQWPLFMRLGRFPPDASVTD